MNKITDTKLSWETYANNELDKARPVLSELGYTLDTEQVHTSGERYLMSGRKLVLLGRDTQNGKCVVVKLSSDPMGIGELEHEHSLHETIPKIDFAYKPFRIPREILFTRTQKFVISVTEHIEQTNAFLKHSLEEQFFLAMLAFEMQEGVQATTYGHTRLARNAFTFMHAKDYHTLFKRFAKNIIANSTTLGQLADTIKKAELFYETHVKQLELYCGFLTHDDFVPHNLRVLGRTIYMLDYTSLHFGNKYESWARFINYMVLYNRPLERTLLKYVAENRGEKELFNLRLMRVHKLTQLIAYYTNTLEKTSGDLKNLSLARIEFWRKILEAVLDNTEVSDETVEAYKKQRDALRSVEEKARQREMAQLS